MSCGGVRLRSSVFAKFCGGFPTFGALFGSPYNEDHSVPGFVFGAPYFWEPLMESSVWEATFPKLRTMVLWNPGLELEPTWKAK